MALMRSERRGANRLLRKVKIYGLSDIFRITWIDSSAPMTIDSDEFRLFLWAGSAPIMRIDETKAESIKRLDGIFVGASWHLSSPREKNGQSLHGRTRRAGDMQSTSHYQQMRPTKSCAEKMAATICIHDALGLWKWSDWYWIRNDKGFNHRSSSPLMRCRWYCSRSLHIYSNFHSRRPIKLSHIESSWRIFRHTQTHTNTRTHLTLTAFGACDVCVCAYVKCLRFTISNPCPIWRAQREHEVNINLW